LRHLLCHLDGRSTTPQRMEPEDAPWDPDLAQIMMRCKFFLAILSSICWYQWMARQAFVGCIIEPTRRYNCGSQLTSTVGVQMKNSLTVVNDGRRVSRRARTPSPHEVERLSNRIAVLEHILSVLRAELQIAGRKDRSKIGPRRVSLCVRRPIAVRYQTPAESGSRRASSRP
jgi:hypothetical protein